MVKTRSLFRALLLAGTAAMLSLGAGGPGAAASKYRVAFFVPVSNSWTAVTTAGAKEVIEAAGGTMTILDSNYNAETQATQLRDAVTSKNFDAFILMPVDGAGVVPFVKEAIDSGVKVAVDTLAVGADTTTKAIQVPGIVSSMTLPAAMVGGSLGDEVVKRCEGIDPCTVVILQGSRAVTYDAGVLVGIGAKLSAHPSIKVLSTVEGGYAADSAYTAMRDVFLAHPDLKFVLSFSDPMISGAVRAAEDAKLTLGPKGINLVSAGGGDLAKQLILSGKMVSSKIDLPKTQGRMNAQNILLALDGKPLPANNALYTTGDLAPFPFLNADNAAKFTPEWAGQ